MSTKNLITALGGITGLARLLKHRNPSTVQGWWERGIIPSLRWPEVLEVAERAGVPVKPEDFLPSPEQVDEMRARRRRSKGESIASRAA